jgi:hypothetical protein
MSRNDEILFSGNQNNLSPDLDACVWFVIPKKKKCSITEYRRRKECRVCVPTENFRQKGYCCLVQVSCLSKEIDVSCQRYEYIIQTKLHEIHVRHKITEFVKNSKFCCWPLYGCVNSGRGPKCNCLKHVSPRARRCHIVLLRIATGYRVRMADSVMST